MVRISYYNTVLSVSIVILAFISYFIIGRIKTIAKYLNNRMGEEEKGQIRIVLFQRLTGFLFFGIIPAIVYMLFKKSIVVEHCLRIHFNLSSLIYIVSFGIIAVIINYFTARSPENLSIYPQIRAKTWTISLLLLSSLSWMVYLFAYEFLFRGILLITCLGELSIINAVAINVILYSLVHIPKGIKEIIGAIPLGVILCLLTIHFGTIWTAFWIHCCLALSNEWFSLKYHPGMNIHIK